jgi:hypothetical protein
MHFLTARDDLMLTFKKIGLISISVISLAACGGSNNSDSQGGPQASEEATYRLTFNAKWNATDFPTGFPGNPHFSPVVGATHNDQDFLWKTGEPSTDGVKNVAETGSTDSYKAELEAKKVEGNVDNIFQGSGTPSPGETVFEFKANKLHPYISAISMIAPSPDWFIGIRDVNLYANNEWLEKQTFDLKLYDAGSDLGITFSADNEAGGSNVISLLTENAVDINAGVHSNSGKFVGTFTIDRIDNKTAQ